MSEQRRVVQVQEFWLALYVGVDLVGQLATSTRYPDLKSAARAAHAVAAAFPDVRVEVIRSGEPGSVYRTGHCVACGQAVGVGGREDV